MRDYKAIGKKIAATNKAKYGEDYYAKIGSMGGKRSYQLGRLDKIGFAAHPERASAAGRKGGRSNSV